MIEQNYIQDSVDKFSGRKQELEDLLRAGDISEVLSQMESRTLLIEDAMKDYDTNRHAVNYREDKIVKDKNGSIVRREKVWKIPIPYPVYINELSLVFLYGRPVKWSQKNGQTDNAFEAFIDVINRTRFDAKIRQAKRLAGAETESALLFRVFRNDEGKADVQIRVLAKSKGDDIYVRWDQYENLLSVAWGHYVRESSDRTIYYVDIFMSDAIYHCSHQSEGWSVQKETNLIGKIPIILLQQEKEWAGTEAIQDRLEYIMSRTADTNDYFADPIAIMNADIVKNLPEKSAANKLLVTRGTEGVDGAAKYLTWDSAPQSKKEEIEWLEEKLFLMSFTPKITLETLKSISQLSAKALNTVMLLAKIKASKRKETHDELMSRTASLIKAIIGRVLNVSLYEQCEKMEVIHEFQEPFADDLTEILTNIVKAYDSGILSKESAVGLNPLVKDPQDELEKIESEAEENREQYSFEPEPEEQSFPFEANQQE